MEMLKQMRRLFAYDDWANRETIASLEAAITPPPKSLKLLAHVLAAERLWLERLKREKQSVAVWPDLSVDECRAHAVELERLWREYLDGLSTDGLAETVSYTNSKGEEWASKAEDVLMHVITHSAYHRGQIAANLRAAGHSPAYTDLIHGVRQGLIE
jgi:uncharacterized damage-inducible protein DinB